MQLVRIKLFWLVIAWEDFAREYIQNSSHWIGNSHRVAKLVTSGTPHGGSNSTSFWIGVLIILMKNLKLLEI